MVGVPKHSHNTSCASKGPTTRIPNLSKHHRNQARLPSLACHRIQYSRLQSNPGHPYERMKSLSDLYIHRNHRELFPHAIHCACRCFFDSARNHCKSSWKRSQKDLCSHHKHQKLKESSVFCRIPDNSMYLHHTRHKCPAVCYNIDCFQHTQTDHEP